MPPRQRDEDILQRGLARAKPGERQILALDQGERLGKTYTAFQQRWFQRGWDGYGLDPFPFTQGQIQDRLRDICLTIDPRDWMDIDEPIERDVVVHLPDKAMDQYREMEKRAFLEIEHALGTHSIDAVNAAVLVNKCLQIASGFIYRDNNGKREALALHTAKLEALDSIIEEANGMPVLISVSFVEELEMLKRHFPKLRHIDEVDCSEHGEWNKGRVPMMACHPASAGHGLNLQWGSNILVDYSSGWDLEYDMQIIERIGPTRQMQCGLDRAVYRYRILAHGTADYLVKRRRETKMSVQATLLEAMKRREAGLPPVAMENA